MDFKKLMVGILLTSMIILPMVVAAGDWSAITGNNVFGDILKYIFGEPVTYQNINNVSAGIITIAVWLLIMITFADIIANFSTFSKPVSWGTGILIGIIAANLGWTTAFFAMMTGIFATLGGIAVYLGLLGAFITFIAVNLGISWLGGFVMRRKAFMEAAKAEEGGTKLAGRLKGLSTAGKALEGM